MEKNFSKRITALSAALAVIAGSAVSCGKKEKTKEEKKTAQQLMAASYHAEMIDTGFDCDDVSSMAKLDDGRIFISARSYDSASPSFYIADTALTNFDEVKMDLGIKEEDDARVTASLAPDGKNIVVMATFIDYGDMEKPDYDDPNFNPETFDFEEYEKNIKETYKLYTVDLEGKKISENEINGLDDYTNENGRLRIADICPCNGGKAIFTIYGDMDQSYVVVNSDGSFDQELKIDGLNWINGLMPIDKDNIAVMGDSDNGYSVKFINAESFEKAGEDIEFTDLGYSGINGLFAGNEEYKYFASTEKGISGVDKDGKTTEIINWVDSDMGSGYVSSCIPVENDEYIIYFGGYMSDSENGFYRLTKRDASELENTKVITVATLYDDWAVKSKVTAFNKSHDGVRFKIEDYSKYEDFDEEKGKYNNSALAQLKKDIGTGNGPDMIVSYDTGIYESLYKKGLFVDLYELMDKDPDINKDKIMPNVLQACERNGKLYFLSPSFTVATLAAKKSNCDKENWTIDEMIEAYDNLPEGMRLTPMDCKEYMLQMTIALLADAIDYEKGTCNFDTPEVRKLLAFIDKFPSQKDMVDENNKDEMMNLYNSDNIKNNKILVEEMYLSDFVQYTEELKGKFEGDISFVGFPSPNGKGSLLSLNQSIGISAKSENKDECWEFFKTFFEEPDEDDQMYSSGFSSLKSVFDKAAEKSMKKPTYKDENGKIVEQDLSVYSNGKEVKIDPLNEKEKDFIVNYILNSSQASDSMDPDVQMIISEEIMAYINGEKKADEIIDLIQNRVSLLVSEQS